MTSDKTSDLFHDQYPSPALNGLILAGGKSERMGMDKSMLDYNGKAQRDHLFELLTPLCQNVFISCNNLQSEEILLPKIADCFGESGPMGGLLSAFKHTSTAAWLIIACDMPFVTSLSFAYLVNHRNPAKNATAFMDPETCLPEPLLTIWEPSAYAALQQSFDQGHHSLRRILMDINAALLTPPDAAELQNINDHATYTTIIQKIKPISVDEAKDFSSPDTTAH